MADISCKVIEDLLPLYVDGVVSVETAELIREHLKTCSDCREYLSRLSKSAGEAGSDIAVFSDFSISKDRKQAPGTGGGDHAEAKDRNREFRNTLVGIKKKIRSKRLKAVLLAVLIAAAAAGGLYYGIVLHESYVPYEKSGLYTENGVIKTQRDYSCLYGVSAPDSETEFVWLTDSVYSRRRGGSKTIEVMDPSNSVTTWFDDDDNIIETHKTKAVYYVPAEYAKQLEKKGFGELGISMDAVDEVKAASILIWESGE